MYELIERGMDYCRCKIGDSSLSPSLSLSLSPSLSLSLCVCVSLYGSLSLQDWRQRAHNLRAQAALSIVLRRPAAITARRLHY